MTNPLLKIKTLGELKASGYVSKPIHEELRDNLILKLKKREKIFDSINLTMKQSYPI